MRYARADQAISFARVIEHVQSKTLVIQAENIYYLYSNRTNDREN